MRAPAGVNTRKWSSLRWLSRSLDSLRLQTDNAHPRMGAAGRTYTLVPFAAFAENPMSRSILNVRQIRDARDVLREVPEILETPTIYSAGLSAYLSKEYGFRVHIYLKLETLQTTRSYKIRGAYNKISRLVEVLGQDGIVRIVTASAGNHAQGVGFAARTFGLARRTEIFMPNNAPLPKKRGTEQYGVTIREVEPPFDNAREKALEAAQERGVHFIPPYDDIDVMAGQGTIGLEILEALESNDMAQLYRAGRRTVVCSIGGGGLLAGLATCFRAEDPEFRVIGVEPLGSAKTKSSLQAGVRIERSSVTTMADGVAVKQLGEATFDSISRHLNARDIYNVSEARILLAIRRLIMEGIVAEGAGALPLAALLHYRPRNGVGPDGEDYEEDESLPLDLVPGEHVVLVLSGANLKPEHLQAQVAELVQEQTP